MNLKEIEKVVASIQSQLFKNSNSYSIGMLKSHFKGAGLQFKEHQVYAPGDDVRFIDWKLSAKTNTMFIKTFEEERNIEIHTFIDVTETMFVGYKGVSKLQAAIELTCLLYLLADKTKDKVSPIIYIDRPIILPLASGQEGIIMLISQLQKLGLLNNDGKLNLGFEIEMNSEIGNKKIALIKSLVARRKEVVLLTDFSSYDNLDILKKLFYRRNLHTMKLESPIETQQNFPFMVFGRSNKKSGMSKSYTKDNKLQEKDRFKRINVKERYLESFIREML